MSIRAIDLADYSGTLLSCFLLIATMNAFGVSSDGYKGGIFIVPGSEKARLEIEAGVTERVEIPFRRDPSVADFPATNIVTMSYQLKGESSPRTEDKILIWETGVTESSFVYSVPLGLSPGNTVKLTLKDGENPDTPVAVSAIHVVDPVPNSVSNPYWIGERTPETFRWGEWTMDLEMVKEKCAKSSEKGYTLVMVSGALWCPDCFSIDKFLNTEAFKNWSRENHVGLVLLDVPLVSSGFSLPLTFLSHFTHNGVSGSSYLSRKGILMEEAAPVTAQNLKYRQGKLWALPGTQKGLWVPTIFLIGKDGRIAGRLDDDEQIPAPHQGIHPVESNLARLDELLRLADDPFEENDCYWATTERFLAPSEVAHGEIQANDRVDIWKLKVSKEPMSLTATLPEPQGDYIMSLFTVDDSGEAKVLSVSSYTGEALVLNALLHRRTGDLFIKIEGTATGFPDTATGATFKPYSFSYETSEFQSDIEDPLNPKLYTGLDLSMDLPIDNIQEGDSVSLRTVGGRLPRGIRARYDRNKKAIVFTGMASRSGHYRTDLQYRVRNRRTSKDEVKTLSFNFEIGEIDEQVQDQMKSVIWPALPLLISARNSDARCFKGVLKLSVSSSGRISARCDLGESSITFRSGKWIRYDPQRKMLSAKLKSSRDDYLLTLNLLKDGTPFAIITDPLSGQDADNILVSLPKVPPQSTSRENIWTDYEGYYTVGLACDFDSHPPSIPVREEELPLPSSSGYLTLNIKGSSALRQGRVRCSGIFPNGSSMICTAYLIPGFDEAILPIFNYSSSESLDMFLFILPGMKDSFLYDPRAITSYSQGSNPYMIKISNAWRHRKNDEFSFIYNMSAYGSYYAPGSISGYERENPFEKFISDIYGTTHLSLTFGSGREVLPSPSYGACTLPSPYALEVQENRLQSIEERPSIRVQSDIRRGLVRFTLPLAFEGRNLSARGRGAIIPGWFECDNCGDGDILNYPLISGALFFMDRYGQFRSFKRSIGFDIDPEKMSSSLIE